jgi:outer membrane protein assembly factor BamD
VLRQKSREGEIEAQARHVGRHDELGGRFRDPVARGRRRIIRGCHDVRSMPPMTASLFLNRLRGFAIVVLCAAFAGGCSLLPDMGKDETTGWSAERLYKEAHEALGDGNFTRAASLFEKIEARFPYGRFAQQAILEGAYANYRMGEAEAASAACDRFIRTYPNHPNVDYALFLKGLVYFREDQGVLGYVYELDPAERDPKAMRDSYAAFKELVARFPDSKYADDARDRLRFLANAMARHEVLVARYYYNRGAYIAAANRAQASLLTYPRQPANEEALDVMVKAYDKMGLTQLRDDSRRILEATYPNSRFLVAAAPKPWWKFW